MPSFGFFHSLVTLLAEISLTHIERGAGLQDTEAQAGALKQTQSNLARFWSAMVYSPFPASNPIR